MYNPKSRRADEFINREEIEATLKWAEEHKSDRPLIESLIDKARTAKGLTHREAAVLLFCDLEDCNERIFSIAREVKEKIYGNRIVLFAPLYLSNHCVNTCTYCPYHAKNKNIVRKKLTQEEITREVVATPSPCRASARPTILTRTPSAMPCPTRSSSRLWR